MNVLSVVEDNLLESISSTEWHYDDEEADFSYVSERHNHFLSHLSEEDRLGIDGLLALEQRGMLMVSTFWSMRALLIEQGGIITPIQEETTEYRNFELISSGSIMSGNTIFLSSIDIQRTLQGDTIVDMAELESEKFGENIEEIAKREHLEGFHLIRIKKVRENIEKAPWKKHTLQKDIIIDKIGHIRENIEKAHWYKKIHEGVSAVLYKRQKNIMVWFFILGIILFFLLISYLVTALFQATTTSGKDAKNELLRAKSLIEESQKISGNQEAFDISINQAIEILSELQEKELYIKETTELSLRIEAMKKEIYDIQTIDLSKKKSIIAFNPTDISPLGIYEYGKKLFLIGKASVINNYAPGEPLPKATTYPPGEQIKNFTVTEDGTFFALSESKRVLWSRKNGEVTYVTVTGQDWWEEGDMINNFNGNLYITKSSDGQIYKHKPGINGYSQRAAVLPEVKPNIREVGIDGGFYVIQWDGKITRIMTAKWYEEKWLVLNKIPWSYTLGQSGKNTKLTLGTNLKYIYVLDNDRIWIFEPDAKRFQDIKAWNYIAQIELDSPEEIRNIWVPRDGKIYVVTNLWVYDINFEFVDGNIILRS